MDLKEDNLFLISSLDYSQENSVFIADRDSGLIIEGSRKSGKKETIINIISNNLYSRRKVLVVSKDQKAEEEIYHRLSYIQTQCMLINKDSHNLDNIYRKTKDMLVNLSKNTGKTTLSKINLLSRDIDKKLVMLDSINTLFTEKRNCGLSLLEMYTYTKNKISTSDNFYEYYKIFSIRKPFANYQYNDLKNSVDKILSTDILDKYIKYRKFKNNKLFCNIHENITDENIKQGLNKITLSLQNKSILQMQLVDSLYQEDIIEHFIENKSATEEELKKISNIINLKYNYRILERLNKNKKWSPIYWFNYRSILKKEKDNKNKFLEIESNILKEVSGSFKLFNKFLEDFEYLKKLITIDEYNNFVLSLLTTGDCIDYLMKLKNTISMYGTINNITEEIQDLDSAELEVLKYCYDNIELKEEMKDILINLPNIFLYNLIEEIETSEKDILHYYKNFEIILKEIQLSVDTKISFIPLAIKYIWDNKISEILLSNTEEADRLFSVIENKYNKMEIKDLIENFKDVILNLYPCFIVDYDYVNTVLPNKKNLFDVVIFYDGNNIYSDEIKSDIYEAKTCIITRNEDEYNENSILKKYSTIYTNSKMEYEYSSKNIKFDNEFKFVSYLQKEIYETFIKQGYKIKLNVSVSGYIVNLVFYSRDNNTEIVAIECDDAIYGLNYNSKKFELSQRRCLEKIGINLIRIWSRDWWLNKKTEIKKIQRILEDYKLDNS